MLKNKLGKKHLVIALLLILVIVGIVLLVNHNRHDVSNVNETVAKGNKPIDNKLLIDKLDKESDELIKHVYELSPDNIVVGSTYEGNFTDSGKKELLVIFKLLNMPHAGGLDCSVAAVYDQSTFDLISQKTFPSDECNFRVLTDNKNRSYLLFVGSQTYQGYSWYALQLWQLGKEWGLLYPEGAQNNSEEKKYEIIDEGTITVSYPIKSRQGDTTFLNVEWVPEYNLVWNKVTCTLDKVIPDKDLSANSTGKSSSKIKEEHQLANGSKLLFKVPDIKYKSEHIIAIASEKGERVICSELHCSPPVVSPDASKFAFIDHLLWEELGEAYLYDLKKGKSELILKQGKDIKDQHTPKVLCWLDNNRLLAIIGFASGTVHFGGELYLYDVDKGKLSLVLEPGEYQEIRNVEVAEDKVTIMYVNFDEEWNKNTPETITYSMEDFLSLINEKL